MAVNLERPRALAMSLIVMIGVQSSQPAYAHAGRRTAAWTPVDCSTFKVTAPDDSGVDCGYVTVPRRHAAPGGPTIQLATVILPAVGADRRSDPLFVAQGGPGGSSIDSYAMYLLDSPSSRPAVNRDLVIWDQRGTLYSKPALMCPEVSKQELDEAQTNKDSDAEEAAAYRACGERLATEAGDLSAFNSVENADDIEALRVALGYDQINFYGVSYGTELGQFLMRQHPEHLRSVVLDAVVPLSYNLFTEPAFAQQRIGAKYGAIPAQWRWLFRLPPVGAALVGLMVVIVFALLFGRHRSVGRMYYTLLTMAGVIAVLNLMVFGVMGLWRA